MFTFTRQGRPNRLYVFLAMLMVVLTLVQCAGPTPQPTAAPKPAETQAQPAAQSAPTKAPEPTKVVEPTKAADAAAPTTAASAPAVAGNDPFADGCWSFPTQPVTLEIWWHTYPPLDSYVKDLIDRYQKLHPNVKVNATIAGQVDLNQKLTVALASGTGPDILDQDISFLSAYYQKNALEPLNVSVFCAKSQADIEKAYVKGGLDGVTFDGKIYGLPYQSNSMSMFLNNTIFKEAGLDPVKDAPKTWDDMKTLGAKLMKKDAAGKITRNGYEFPYQSQRWMLEEFQPMLEQYGGKLLSADGKQCQLNSDAAVKALTTWRDVSNATGDKALMLATGAQPNQDFIDGRTAMWMTGPWATPQFLASPLKDQWTVVSLPQIDPSKPKTMVYGFTWGVNKARPDLNKQVAWDFVRFMQSKPDEWITKAAMLSPRAGLLDQPEVKKFPFIDVHLKDIETASWYLIHPKTNEIVQIVGKAIERTVMNSMDPKASLDQAQDECTKALSK